LIEEIRDLTIKQQNERMKLEAEIKQFQGLVEIQSGELAILKGKSFENGRINRLEEIVFMVSSENERLTAQILALNEKISDLDSQKLRLSEFYQEKQRNSIETTKQSSYYQVENLQNDINSLQKELEEWKNKARKAELENYGYSASNVQISDLKQQIMNLSKDQQGLLDSLNERKIYIEKIRQKKRVLKQKLRSSLPLEQNRTL
jgi:phage host-nuclease inhibitor protein Gam